jgi:hypothetical protein
MALTRLAGARSPNGIPTNKVKSRAQARGDIFETIAGTTRWLSEYVSGTNETGTFGRQEQVAPPTPINGDGLPGHDHSGGYMGVPLKHTLWSHCYGYVDDSTVNQNNAPLVIYNVPGGKIIEADVGPLYIPPGYIYQRGLRGCCVVKVEGDTCDIVLTFTNRLGQKTEHSGTYAVGTHAIETDGLVQLPTGQFSQCVAKVDVTSFGATTVVRLLFLGLNQIFDEPVPTITAP